MVTFRAVLLPRPQVPDERLASLRVIRHPSLLLSLQPGLTDHHRACMRVTFCLSLSPFLECISVIDISRSSRPGGGRRIRRAQRHEPSLSLKTANKAREWGAGRNYRLVSSKLLRRPWWQPRRSRRLWSAGPNRRQSGCGIRSPASGALLSDWCLASVTRASGLTGDAPVGAKGSEGTSPRAIGY